MGKAQVKKTLSLFAIAAISLILFACQNRPPAGQNLSGRIIVWHSWNSTETAVLEDVFKRFEEINPGVTIIRLALAPQDLLFRFRQSAQEGVGPDLLIGSDDWIQELVDARLIRPYISDGTVPVSALAQQAISYQGEWYGLPISLHPYALYYNKSQVEDSPARTLDDLLLQAAEGQRVAFVPRFEDAYWGIRTTGSNLFDPAGDLDLANSGLVPWLAWLTMAQNRPGIILNVDEASLQELFMEGRVAYFVAGPDKQALFESVMGEDAFGVATLPSGPSGTAGPLLPVEMMYLYEYSSPQQAVLARVLAEFLSNQQQGIRFMRDLARVPANPLITVDARIYPNVSGFSRQANTAVVLPNFWDKASLIAAGNRAYAAALSGALTPESAVCIFGQEVVAAQPAAADRVILPANCTLPAGSP